MKEELELFVWHLNGFEHSVQFTLEVEKKFFFLFLDVGINYKFGRKVANEDLQETYTQQYINWN